jgi:hypothetical protein
MPSVVSPILIAIDRERKALSKVSGAQLWSVPARNSLRGLVEFYFNEVRPKLLGKSREGVDLESIDARMQQLLSLCHKSGSVQKYRDLLRDVKAQLVHVDGQLISTATTGHGGATELDVRILATLRALVPSAALSYEQALRDLQQAERFSWRGQATDLREALRETLDHLAPDVDVESAAGYKVEPDARGPTMKQKVRFILRSRGMSKGTAAPAENAADAVEEAIGAFVRSVYTRSSVSTHTPTNKEEVLRVLDFVRVVLSELLEVR